MTNEKRNFISLDDILAFEFECGDCHVRQSIPIAKFTKMHGECPHCGIRWFKADDVVEKSLPVLAKAIRDVKQQEINALFRVEISSLDGL